MKKPPFISVIIPAYNEESSLGSVIQGLPRDRIRDVIVIDNASTDNTAEVALQNGAQVIYERRRGYGQSCLTGIAHLDRDTDIVVFLDGDFSDYPEELTRLTDLIEKEDYDFVLGSRMQGEREDGAMAPQVYWGNRFACWLIRILWGFRYTDLGRFRAIKFSSLKKLRMTDKNFGWTTEMQIKAAAHKLKTCEIPVRYRRRTGQSKISGTVKGTLLAGEKILRTIFKYRFISPV
jgi:glycosyltransferase involved in cell wall biosynthesis